MKEKILQLKEIMGHIDTMVYVLEGRFNKSDLDGSGTIEEQIKCWDDLGDDFDQVYAEIIEEHGKEQCPFVMKLNG